MLVKVTISKTPACTSREGQAGKTRRGCAGIAAVLAPKITFVFDERALSLTITADSKLFEGTVLDLQGQATRRNHLRRGPQPVCQLHGAGG